MKQLEDEILDFQLNMFESDKQFDQEEVRLIADASLKGVDLEYPEFLAKGSSP